MAEMYEIRLKNGRLYRAVSFLKSNGFLELHRVGIYNFIEKRWEFAGKLIYVPFHAVEEIRVVDYDFEKEKKKKRGGGEA